MDLRQRTRVRTSVKQCKSCSLHSQCNGPVPFSGPSPAKIAVIGEAPGENEDTQNRPFVGPAGRMAKQLLRNTGMDPDSYAWLNVVSCYPHRTPSKQEVSACRGNLERQLVAIQPAYLLLFGGVAASSWYPQFRITDLRGLWWRAEVKGLDYKPWALATWHPSYVLRNRKVEGAVLEDLDVFKMVAEEGSPPPVSRWCAKCQKREVVNWRGDLGYCWECTPKEQGSLLTS